jgi:phospholipase C
MTATPIKHLVVIFNENDSFGHYFATYRNAANSPGEPAFTAILSDSAIAANVLDVTEASTLRVVFRRRPSLDFLRRASP